MCYLKTFSNTFGPTLCQHVTSCNRKCVNDVFSVEKCWSGDIDIIVHSTHIYIWYWDWQWSQTIYHSVCRQELRDWHDTIQSWTSLQWRHNECNGVANHQPHDCLLKCLFKRISKKISKLRVTGLCEGNSPTTGGFPAQRASNAENASIWWRHHEEDIFEFGMYHQCSGAAPCPLVRDTCKISANL